MKGDPDQSASVGMAGWGLVAATALALTLAGCAATPRYSYGPVARTDAASGVQVDRDSQPHSGSMRPYAVGGIRYRPRLEPDYVAEGVASWYGGRHNGRMTANGEIFDGGRLSAAHRTLPLPSVVEVTNLENGRRLKVRVNDRGPFVRGRLIDLSEAAAEALGFKAKGTARVRVRFIGPAARS